LDNVRVTEPVEVRPGQAAQLGAGGPVLRIARIELAPSAQPVKPFNLETQRDDRSPGEATMGTSARKSTQQQPAQPPQPARAATPEPAIQQQHVQQPPAQKSAPPARPAEPAFIEHVSGATGQLGRV